MRFKPANLQHFRLIQDRVNVLDSLVSVWELNDLLLLLLLKVDHSVRVALDTSRVDRLDRCGHCLLQDSTDVLHADFPSFVTDDHQELAGLLVVISVKGCDLGLVRQTERVAPIDQTGA